jgi:hypothetical protein
VVFPKVIVLALAPVPILTAPVVPESRVMAEVVVEEIVPAPAKVRAVAEVAIVSIDTTPVSAPPVVTFNPPLDARENVPVALPITTLPVPVVAMFTLEAPVVPRLVPPVELKVVNAPVLAVVAPMAVEFMPVAVVVIFPEVKVILLAPVLIEEALKPDKERAPEVPVRFKAPVVKVNPLEAVRAPAELMVPVPVVEIFEEVVISLVVEIVPKPEAMEPEKRAPTAERDEVTTFEARVVPEIFAAAFTVIEAFGKVMVRAAVGSVMTKVVSFASTVAPSNTSGEPPARVVLPKVSTPEVAVRFKAPVLKVKPSEAVSV